MAAKGGGAPRAPGAGRRGYIIVEGQGETEAAQQLISRLWHDLGYPAVGWRTLRGKNLLNAAGVHQYANVVRGYGDAAALLLLRDADDDCPQQTGPRTAGWLRELQLPFAAGVTLLCREYETLFLPCLADMAGKPFTDALGQRHPGLKSSASFRSAFEAPRGVKRVIDDHMQGGGRYRPTAHQLPLTRMIDFDVLRRSELPSFGTLERTVRFLRAHWGRARAVYP